ncbi:MAG: murein hydrolase activator EnvC family protein [Gemmatimonadaceae bacterium]
MRWRRRDKQGYGNIYTPHAGSMIIHVQRESGLANRTITLTQRQIAHLRLAGIIVGSVLAVLLASWFVLIAQAAKVPMLNHRLARLQHEVSRVDTLQLALTDLERRFQQVQRMLGGSSSAVADEEPNVAGGVASPPRLWPLPVAGRVVTPFLPPSQPGLESGVDVAVPLGTPVRSAGAGVVTDVLENVGGSKRIRIRHIDGFETIYANTTDVLVEKGDKVLAGAAIALTGGADDVAVPHLHFILIRGGVSLDPVTFLKQGHAHGDLQ